MVNTVKTPEPIQHLAPPGIWGVHFETVVFFSCFFFFFLSGRAGRFPPPPRNTSPELWHFQLAGAKKLSRNLGARL